MAIFGSKPWVTPFRKMSLFRLFELLVFIAQKGIFSFQNIVRDVFLVYVAKKKKFEKWPFLDQNHGITTLEKCDFFDFLIFFFLQPRKTFIVVQYRKRHLPGLYCLKKKVGKTAIFGPKPWVNHFRKLSIFKLFKLLVFIAYKGIFLFQKIVKDIFLVYIA